MNSEGKTAIISSKALWVIVTDLNLTLRNYSVWDNKLGDLTWKQGKTIVVIQKNSNSLDQHCSNPEKYSNNLGQDSGSRGGEKCLHSRYILKVLLTGLVNK